MNRNAFTLIEVLIVVVIMATLAAVIIPQFSSSVDDSKAAALKHNLQSLREIIQIYRAQHGSLPALTSGSLPGLTMATDATGATNAVSNTTYPFGPYIQGGKLPVNPFDGKNTVSQTNTFPPTAATAAGGWFYEPGSGQIAGNTAGHLTD
jgi:general secretion pathway protein G